MAKVYICGCPSRLAISGGFRRLDAVLLDDVGPGLRPIEEVQLVRGDLIARERGAIEHLRAICSELQIAHVRQQLSFSMFTDFENFSTFAPGPQHDDASGVLFDQLEAWTRAMKTVRD